MSNLAALLLSVAFGQACPVRDCPTFTDKTICLIGPGSPDDAREAAALRSFCGDDEPVRVKDKADLAKRIRELADRCVRVDRLFVSAAGAPGAVVLDAKEPTTPMNAVEQLGPLGCLMKKNARIHLSSGLTGFGCRGEDALVGFARALLPEGGRVSAPMGFRADVTDAYFGPFNSPRLTLDYAPGAPEKWSEGRGDGRENGERAHAVRSKNCADEIDSAVKTDEQLRDQAARKSCKVKDSSEAVKEAKRVRGEFASRKIPDRRHSPAYDAGETFRALARLDRAASEIIVKCGSGPSGKGSAGKR